MERIIAIIGATGTGKTTLLRKLLQQTPRTFLFDPTHDPKFNNWAPVTRSLKDAGRLSLEKHFRVRLVMESPTAFDAICELAFVYRKNCTIAIDEVHEFCSSNHAGGIPFWFRRCLLRGRHEGVSVIGSTQRCANVHNDFLMAAAASRVYLFRSPVEDLGGLKKYKQFHAAADLKTGQFLTWPAS